MNNSKAGCSQSKKKLQMNKDLLKISTLYNVCLVHRGMFSTSGVFSASEGYQEHIGGIS